jgi:hypothetical protein
MGVLWMVLGNAGVTAFAYELSAFENQTRSSRALTFLILRLLLVSVLTLSAGMAHLLTAPVLGGAGAVLLVLVAARRRRSSLKWIEPSSMPASLRVPLALLAIVVVKLLVQAVLLAPSAGDVLSYHLPKIAEWVRAGAITRYDGPDEFATLPAGFELVETWWVVFLHHDVLIECAGMEFWFLAVLATYGLALRLGLTQREALLGALFFGILPGMQTQAVNCLNDGPVAALVLATFAVLAHERPVPELMMVLGLGIGVKATYLYASPGFVVAWYFLRRNRSVAITPRRAWALGVLALLLGSSWYVRNAVTTGNPFHPVGGRAWVDDSGARRVQVGPRFTSLVANGEALVTRRLQDTSEAYCPLLCDMAGWGGIAIAGVGVLTGMVRREVPLGKMTLAFLASMLGVLSLAAPDPWSMRFALFFPALPCIAIAKVVAESRPGALAVGTAAAFQFVGTLLPATLTPDMFGKLLASSWKDRSFAVASGVRLPSESIAYFGDRHGSVYPLYGPDYSRAVLFTRPKNGDDLVEQMKRASTRFLYARPKTNEEVSILGDCLRRHLLRRLDDNLYRLGN